MARNGRATLGVTKGKEWITGRGEFTNGREERGGRAVWVPVKGAVSIVREGGRVQRRGGKEGRRSSGRPGLIGKGAAKVGAEPDERGWQPAARG